MMMVVMVVATASLCGGQGEVEPQNEVDEQCKPNATANDGNNVEQNRAQTELFAQDKERTEVRGGGAGHKEEGGARREPSRD